MMRSYPLNSAQAAARVLALALLADGRLASEEILMLDYVRAHEQLGLSVNQLDAVVEAFRQDIEVGRHPGWSEESLVDPRTMAGLMAEIDDPLLRKKVLRLCIAVVEADGRVHGSESVVINAAVEHWGLHRDMFALYTPERPLRST
jgi:uncharacterized tellurite resistance protein B-like protein